MKLCAAGVGIAMVMGTVHGAAAADMPYRYTAVKVLVPDCEKRQLIPKQWLKEGIDPQEGVAGRPGRDEFAPEVLNEKLYRSLCLPKKNSVKSF